MFLPRNRLRLGSFDAGTIGKNMGVPADNLVHDGADNIVEIEEVLLLRHLRMEDDLEQEIAEFVLQRRPVFILDRACDFVSFFDLV